jgi:hypothetical protein
MDRHDLSDRDSNIVDEPASQIVSDRYKMRDQRGKDAAESHSSAILSFGITNVPTVFAVNDHGDTGRPSGGNSVKRCPVPGVDHMRPEPAEEPQEPKEGLWILPELFAETE